MMPGIHPAFIAFLVLACGAPPRAVLPPPQTVADRSAKNKSH